MYIGHRHPHFSTFVTKFSDRQTEFSDRRTDKRPDEMTNWLLLLFKIPNKTLKVPNNTDEMNRIYCNLLFSVPNKCHLICQDGQTDEQG